MKDVPVVVLTTVVAGVVVLAGVAGVVSARRSPAPADLGTPEGTVQAYLTAVLDHDVLGAADLLAPGTCGVDDLAAAWIPEARVDLTDTRLSDGTAVVVVEVTETGEGLLPGPGHTHLERLVLEREGQEWRLTGTPWPLVDCWR